MLCCALSCVYKLVEYRYKISGGLHGVGVSVVNALSINLKATVKREGMTYCLKFSRGKTISKLTSTPNDDSTDLSTDLSSSTINKIDSPMPELNNWRTKSGTEISFQPDPEIFKLLETTDSTLKPSSSLKNVFEYDKLTTRLDELAYLNRIKLTLTDFRNKEQSLESSLLKKPHFKVFEHKGGIPEYLELLCKHKMPLHPEVRSHSSPYRDNYMFSAFNAF